MLFSPSRIGILVFAAAAITGPWYTVEEYSPVSNLISELGAQNTQNSSVMMGDVQAASNITLGCMGAVAVDTLETACNPHMPMFSYDPASKIRKRHYT